MAATGLDSTIVLRAKFAMAAISKYAINKLRDGDYKCHLSLMDDVNRINNLRLAIASENLTDAISDTEIYCLNRVLFSLLDTYQYIPGMVSSQLSNIDLDSDGIGNMSIFNGFGNLFIITE